MSSLSPLSSLGAGILSYDYVMVIPLVWQCCLWAGSLALFQGNFWRRCCPRGLPKLARRIGRGGIPIAGFAAAKISPESHKGLALQFRHFHLYWVCLETVIGSNTKDWLCVCLISFIHHSMFPIIGVSFIINCISDKSSKIAKRQVSSI